MHLQMNREAACRSHNPEWDPDSVPAIPIQPWQSRDTQLPLEINFRIRSYQPIWHPKKPKWIGHRQSYDVQQGDDRTGIKSNPYCKESSNRTCWEVASWSALMRRDHQQSQQAYVKKSQQCTWRWSGKQIQKTMLWIPRQVIARIPGEGAETIPEGKPASNWRW